MLDFKSNEISESKFVYQRGISDCGVACLTSLLRSLGRSCDYETIYKLSKCNFRGTSIMGLQNAAKFYNYIVDAFEFKNLNEFRNSAKFPCIILIRKYYFLNHYIICYKKPTETTILVFDPSKGFELLTNKHLVNVWKFNIALFINTSTQPNDKAIL